jgi:hypothetical protein
MVYDDGGTYDHDHGVTDAYDESTMVSVTYDHDDGGGGTYDDGGTYDHDHGVTDAYDEITMVSVTYDHDDRGTDAYNEITMVYKDGGTYDLSRLRSRARAAFWPTGSPPPTSALGAGSICLVVADAAG